MLKLFDKPKIIGVIGDVNSGKSNLIYYLLDSLTKEYKFSLYSYGLRVPFPASKEIFSVEELEECQNSLIVLDEVMSLFDLDNRKRKSIVENCLRLIHHNNNILVLSLLPENAKKFISSKINVHLYKKCTIPDFINGSLTKRLVDSYNGPERGSMLLALPVEKSLMVDKHYQTLDIPYMKKYDAKAGNPDIFKKKKGGQK